MNHEPGPEVAKGFGLLLLMHLLFFAALNLLIRIATENQRSYLIQSWDIPLFFIGLLQLIYVLPACAYFRRRQQLEIIKGITIGATLTAIINGGCFLYIAALLASAV